MTKINEFQRDLTDVLAETKILVCGHLHAVLIYLTAINKQF